MDSNDVAAGPRPSQSVTRELVVANPQGIHLRPATAFAALAADSGCSVVVMSPRGEANGASALELVMLAIPQGTAVTILVEGDGCEETADALASIARDGV